MKIPQVVRDAFASKKFLAFLTSLVVLWGNRIVARLAPGFEMDPTEVALAVGTLATYIVGQGIADHGSTAAKIAANAPAQPSTTVNNAPVVNVDATKAA